MIRWGGTSTALAMLACAACGHAQPAPATPIAKARLAILPTESDAFPVAAEAATASLVKAHFANTETRISKVSLEVVQLSIECVDPSLACYVAAGRSLSANRLLFAELAGTKHAVSVTVTQLDVDASVATKTATKTFASETEAANGIAALVSEATRP